MRRLYRRLGSALLVASVLSASVACGSEPRTAAAPTTSSTPSPTPTPTPEPPPVLWPLTGLEAPTPSSHPALAVKIENSYDARPQTGLNAADVVWEQVVEGGITRFVAVYHSTLPPEIGPVRSIRPMDPGIAGPLGGLLVFSGGGSAYISAAQEAGLQVVSYDSGAGGFYRVSARSAPHNIYAEPQALVAQADATHTRAPGGEFAFAGEDEQPTAVSSGTPTAVLQLRLSGVGQPQWTWSQSDGRWLRSEGTTPAVEPDGTQLGAANVVVLRVDVVNTSRRDAAGNPVPETVMVSSGEALVASGGRTVAATWSKASVTAPVVLTGADGQPILLAPGNTWVELVPNGTGSVTVG